MRALATILTAVLLVGCASAASEQETDATTFVEVQNRSTLDMNIHVIPEGGVPARLGTVPGVSTETFRIPSRMIFGVTQLRFRADPVGSARESVTQDIMVSPGDTVVLQIPPA